MEEAANSVEDHLIEGLSFKLRPGASYVQSRRSVSFFPQGGNTYSTTGVKVIKISLTGSQGEWLDPSTLSILYDINNDGGGTATTKHLMMLSGPWSIFRRMRILCGGSVIEDIDSYNRCHEIFHILSSAAKRENDEVMGFGVNSYRELTTWERPFPISLNKKDYMGIVGSKTVMFRPLSGLINQDTYLPFRYMGGLTIELELVSDPNEPIISGSFAYSGDPNAVPPVPATELIANDGYSDKWSIINIQVKADTIQLDIGLNDE